MPRSSILRRCAEPDAALRRYIVTRRQAAWLILFDGQAFGPYRSEREALLFAVDAACKLARQGEQSEVLRNDETGAQRVVWRGEPNERAANAGVPWPFAPRRA
jgi:hypothetical protein